jgi:hypothetical protein
MTVWESSFNGAFWITIATLFIGAVSLAFKYCLKSKCKDINICFGCLRINRTVELEEGEVEMNENNSNNI